MRYTPFRRWWKIACLRLGQSDKSVPKRYLTEKLLVSLNRHGAVSSIFTKTMHPCCNLGEELRNGTVVESYPITYHFHFLRVVFSVGILEARLFEETDVFFQPFCPCAGKESNLALKLLGYFSAKYEICYYYLSATPQDTMKLSSGLFFVYKAGTPAR